MSIEQIPDSPALQQLARALWRGGALRGAAVLVGAGFSRNAERSGADTPEPPLWPDLHAAMVKRLYPRAPEDAPTDPLRLAEEYRIYLGEAALNEFIRAHVRDEAWRPGSLHRALLELPWSDVLTTNWDTLLERAAQATGAYRYEPVRSEADLTHARAPRIIKLHGSLGTSEHFIVTEEDYRTYPARHAPFVNLARQIFLENELCLIGFSGDDPNFLQWAGWVRDHLGGSARRIYLVGALRLGPAKRKLLEARNVAPIDLARLVESCEPGEQQAVATRKFLEFLKGAKPKQAHEWRPAERQIYDFIPTSAEDWKRQHADAEYAAALLEKSAEVWRQDREGYPGWLICPRRLLQELRCGSDHVWPSKASLEALPPERRAPVLYELAWRHKTAFWPIDTLLAALLAEIADPARPCGLGKHRQLEVAAMLLNMARETEDGDAFERWVSILEARAEPGSDLHAEAVYQRLLRSRDCLDYAALSEQSGSLRGEDPTWHLRRAALRCEYGDLEEAGRDIAEAITELRERLDGDRSSLWVRSRLAWALWMAGAVRRHRLEPIEDSWPADLREGHCDPWKQVDEIRGAAADAVRSYRERKAEITPLFDPGQYRRGSAVTRLISPTSVEAISDVIHLADRAGIPLAVGNVHLLSDAAKDAAEVVFEPTSGWHLYLPRALTSHSDPLIERYFGRVAIARLPAPVVTELTGRVTAAITFWRQQMRASEGAQKRFPSCVEQLRMCTEVLSRLTARRTGTEARADFSLAADLAHDPALQHPRLFEQVEHLAERSLSALPPQERASLALPALEFPLPDANTTRHWKAPSPVGHLFRHSVHPERPKTDPHWSSQIKNLIENAGAEGQTRIEAILRLAYLA